MNIWGHELGGESPGWRWIKDTPETAALRCRTCNTYADDVIFGYRPSGEHLDEIVDSVRTLHVVSANDGFAIFDDCVLDRLREGWPSADALTYRVGPGTWTFDLLAMETAATVSADRFRGDRCIECDRFSPVSETARVDDFVVVIDKEPVQSVVRSVELFGRAYNRRSTIYASNAVYALLGFPRNSCDVAVAAKD